MEQVQSAAAYAEPCAPDCCAMHVASPNVMVLLAGGGRSKTGIPGRESVPAVPDVRSVLAAFGV